MSFRRLSSLLGAGVVLVLSLWAGASGQPRPVNEPTPKKPVNEVVQEFPTNESMRTAWKVHWATQEGFGLIIQDAWFKRTPNEPWIQVLGDVRLSELFVPYHSGSPRFWDVSYNFSLLTMTREDAGPFGKLLGKPGDRPTIVQEVRDRGIAWMDGNKKRRGQTLVLWAALDAANYRYVIEYGFQDDGAITFRVGSTGHNYASREWEAHMHNGLWRVDVNLDGPEHNSVLVMEHFEPDGVSREKARTDHRPFNNGREGYLDWNAERFTMLTVINEKKKNARGKPWGYDLVPLRMGNARHFAGDKEDCTLHDFWVTRARKDEIYYTRVHKYVEKGEPILNTDVVLWHSSAGHHEPRSEDGEMKGNSLVGATPVMWCGFDLRPRNFFDRSPLYP